MSNNSSRILNSAKNAASSNCNNNNNNLMASSTIGSIGCSGNGGGLSSVCAGNSVSPMRSS